MSLDLPFVKKDCELEWLEYLFKQFPKPMYEPMSMKKAIQEDLELEKKEKIKQTQKELDDMYKKYEEMKLKKEKEEQERIDKIHKEHEKWMKKLLKYMDDMNRKGMNK